MIDICSISYPLGVKNYISRNDYVPEIMQYLYQHPEPVTVKTICNALQVPNRKITIILTNLFNRGVVKRSTHKQYGNTPCFSYWLNETYQYKLTCKEQKEIINNSTAAGGVAA